MNLQKPNLQLNSPRRKSTAKMPEIVKPQLHKIGLIPKRDQSTNEAKLTHSMLSFSGALKEFPELKKNSSHQSHPKRRTSIPTETGKVNPLNNNNGDNFLENASPLCCETQSKSMLADSQLVEFND